MEYGTLLDWLSLEEVNGFKIIEKFIIMISRKDALLNPEIRKYIVKTLYRHLFKNYQQVFDTKIKEDVKKFIDVFKA
jgi:hypothetical protein